MHSYTMWTYSNYLLSRVCQFTWKIFNSKSLLEYCFRHWTCNGNVILIEPFFLAYGHALILHDYCIHVGVAISYYIQRRSIFYENFNYYSYLTLEIRVIIITVSRTSFLLLRAFSMEFDWRLVLRACNFYGTLSIIEILLFPPFEYFHNVPFISFAFSDIKKIANLVYRVYNMCTQTHVHVQQIGWI